MNPIPATYVLQSLQGHLSWFPPSYFFCLKTVKVAEDLISIGIIIPNFWS